MTFALLFHLTYIVLKELTVLLRLSQNKSQKGLKYLSAVQEEDGGRRF